MPFQQKLSKTTIFILVVTSIVISSCRYSRTTLGNGGGASNSTLNAEDFISYDLVKTTSMKTCENCHSGNQAPDLTSLAGIQNNLTLIQDETSTGGMPPVESGYTSLDACSQAVLDQWLSMGAPEITSVQVKSIAACHTQQIPPVEVPIENSPLTYDTLVTKFLQKKCLQCHNASSSDPDSREILFFPYTEVTKNPKYWSSPSAKSKVMQEITSQDMPPSDSGVAPATAEEIDFVKRWIDAGRPQ